MTSQTDRATFTATEEEEQLATQVLIIKNCRTAGILSTDAATDIFKRSTLPDETLREIWALSDKDRNGHFSRNELTAAFRLMGWAQAGETLHAGLLAKSTFYYCSKDVVAVDRSVQRARCPPWKVYRMWSSGLRLSRIIHHKSLTSNPTRYRITGKYSLVLVLLMVTWMVSSIFHLSASNSLNHHDTGDKVMDGFMTSNLSYEHLRKIRLVRFSCTTGYQLRGGIAAISSTRASGAR